MGLNSDSHLSLLHINLPSPITANQLLLSIPCFKFVTYQLAINVNCKPAGSQYSLIQVCCTSTCHQRSLQPSCYYAFPVSSFLLFNLQSTITLSQLLLSIPCFKFVALQLAINDYSQLVVTQYFLFLICYTSTCQQRSILTSCCSLFLFSSLLLFNLLLPITHNQMFLITQYSFTTCNQRSLLTSCC